MHCKKGGKDQESIQALCTTPGSRLTQAWESDKTQLNITNDSQEVSTFPAGDHNASKRMDILLLLLANVYFGENCIYALEQTTRHT